MRHEWPGTFLSVLARLLLALVLAMTATLAEAKKSKQKAAPKPDNSMWFVVVRSSSPLCEPICPEWIAAQGDIRPDTAQKFKKFMKTVGKRKLPVIIQSPGGSVEAAFAMGRQIRALGLDVAVGYTTFSSCAPTQKGCEVDKKVGYTGIAAPGFAYCYSACPFVLAAGTKRLAGPWVQVGVHQITTTMTKQRLTYRTITKVVKGKKVTTKKIVGRKNAGSYTTTKMDKALRRRVSTYFKEMGVSTDLIEAINETSASTMLMLTTEQLRNFKLVTSLNQLDELTSVEVCKVEVIPEHCVDKSGIARSVKPPDTKAAPARPVAVDNSPKTVRFDLDNAMRFVVVRGTDPLCEPLCPEWIAAEGRITAATPRLFLETLQSLGSRKLPVLLTSRGGDFMAAMRLGYLVRARQLDVAIARTIYSSCQPEMADCSPTQGAYSGKGMDFQAECHAACTLVLGAGMRRISGMYPVVSVSYATLMHIEDYLFGMGIGRQLAELMHKPQPEPSAVDLDTLWASGLITSFQSSKVVAGVSACKGKSPPTNCRLNSMMQ